MMNSQGAEQHQEPQNEARFTVTYRVFADSLEEARKRAIRVAHEQTVEVPPDVVPDGFIKDEIVGQIEELEAEADTQGSFRLVLSYSPKSVGSDFPQFLNVMYGNSSLLRGLRIIGISPGPTLTQHFPGARFGIEGLRRLSDRTKGGLICPVIKPQGLSSRDLADIAVRCVRGGADIIKEDHGLASQPTAPFSERCEVMAQAIAQANADTGGHCLYFPSLTGSSTDIVKRAQFAKQTGAHGVLIIPGLLGFDSMSSLARNPDFGLPIMAHPAFLGSFVLGDDYGITHGVMFGHLMRLAGADISVFPNVGGRFGFSNEECLDIVDSCRGEDGPGLPIMPSPGGGMSVDRAKDMQTMYGEDVVYLLGGNLMRYRDRVSEGVAEMRSALDAVSASAA